MVFVALVSIGLYAATEATSTVSVSAPGTSSGAKADVFSVGAIYSAIQGQARTQRGVVLAKLTFADSDYSDDIVVQFLWAAPDEAAGLLLSPVAFLQTGVYFLDTDQTDASDGGYAGSCNSTTQRSFDDGGTKYACPDPDIDKAHKVLSTQMAGTVFQPTVDGQGVLYILADISIPGRAPPGLQTQLTALEFNVAVN